MNEFHWEVEFLLGVTDDLVNLWNTDRDAVPQDIQRLFRRGQGAIFYTDDPSGRWWVARLHINVEDLASGQDRATWEHSPDNQMLAWLNPFFTKYFYPAQREDGIGIRPTGCFWCDNGMQFGTVEDENGDVDIAGNPPAYPYDPRLKDYLPNRVLYDGNGNPTLEEDVVWDVPAITFTHQFHASSHPDIDFRRRWKQVTSDEWLDYTAWGLNSPWTPE